MSRNQFSFWKYQPFCHLLFFAFVVFFFFSFCVCVGGGDSNPVTRTGNLSSIHSTPLCTRLRRHLHGAYTSVLCILQTRRKQIEPAEINGYAISSRRLKKSRLVRSPAWPLRPAHELTPLEGAVAGSRDWGLSVRSHCQGQPSTCGKGSPASARWKPRRTWKAGRRQYEGASSCATSPSFAA